MWVSLHCIDNDFCELLNPLTVFSGTVTCPLRTICVQCCRVALFLLRAYQAQSGKKCSGCVSSTERTTPASLKWMSAHTSSLVNHQVNCLSLENTGIAKCAIYYIICTSPYKGNNSVLLSVCFHPLAKSWSVVCVCRSEVRVCPEMERVLCVFTLVVWQHREGLLPGREQVHSKTQHIKNQSTPYLNSHRL